MLQRRPGRILKILRGRQRRGPIIPRNGGKEQARLHPVRRIGMERQRLAQNRLTIRIAHHDLEHTDTGHEFGVIGVEEDNPIGRRAGLSFEAQVKRRSHQRVLRARIIGLKVHRLLRLAMGLCKEIVPRLAFQLQRVLREEPRAGTVRHRRFRILRCPGRHAFANHRLVFRRHHPPVGSQRQPASVGRVDVNVPLIPIGVDDAGRLREPRAQRRCGLIDIEQASLDRFAQG